MASTSNKITLISSDGQLFELEKEVAIQSVTVKNLIEDDCASDAIPLANVTGPILTKVIEYCKKHVDDQGNNSGDDLNNWDTQFLELVDQNTLFDLILAANYLNIKGLLELTCQAVADMIKAKSPEEIREIFHIKNDYTPEEEEAIRRENQWAFEQGEPSK